MIEKGDEDMIIRKRSARPRKLPAKYRKILRYKRRQRPIPDDEELEIIRQMEEGVAAEEIRLRKAFPPGDPDIFRTICGNTPAKEA